MMNSWQDIVLTIGSLIFIAALIPSVLGKDKPAFWTSASTGSVLAVFAIVYASLDLWFACITTIISASLWGVLAAQRAARKK